jgi:hypothetical protein
VQLLSCSFLLFHQGLELPCRVVFFLVSLLVPATMITGFIWNLSPHGCRNFLKLPAHKISLFKQAELCNISLKSVEFGWKISRWAVFTNSYRMNWSRIDQISMTRQHKSWLKKLDEKLQLVSIKAGKKSTFGERTQSGIGLHSSTNTSPFPWCILSFNQSHFLFSLELPCYIFIDWELFLGSMNFGVDVDQFSNTFLVCMYRHSQGFFSSILWYQKLVEVILEFFFKFQFFGKKMTKFCQKIITGLHSGKKKILTLRLIVSLL